MKLIDLHKKWTKSNIVGLGTGLCAAMPEYCELAFVLFLPTAKEKRLHDQEGYGWSWWGRNIELGEGFSEYTPLRQTIVLLICAMNNEL